jgi:NADH:ubiquinone oxidoreductase subunit 2 (subunit N)
MDTLFLQVQPLLNPNVNIQAILPETIVAVTGIIVMLYDSFVPRQRGVTTAISLIGLLISAFFLISMWTGTPTVSWNGMITNDNLRMSFSIVALLTTAVTILISGGPAAPTPRNPAGRRRRDRSASSRVRHR